MVQAISVHPDFSTTTGIAMNVLSSGTEDITPVSGQTIDPIASLPVSTPSPAYVNITTVSYSHFKCIKILEF